MVIHIDGKDVGLLCRSSTCHDVDKVETLEGAGDGQDTGSYDDSAESWKDDVAESLELCSSVDLCSLDDRGVYLLHVCKEDYEIGSCIHPQYYEEYRNDRMLTVSCYVGRIEDPYDIRQGTIRSHDGIPELTDDDCGDYTWKIDDCLEEILSLDHSPEDQVGHEEAKWNLAEDRDECDPHVVLQGKPEIAVLKHIQVVLEAYDVNLSFLWPEERSTLIVGQAEIKTEYGWESHDEYID